MSLTESFSGDEIRVAALAVRRLARRRKVEHKTWKVKPFLRVKVIVLFPPWKVRRYSRGLQAFVDFSDRPLPLTHVRIPEEALNVHRKFMDKP